MNNCFFFFFYVQRANGTARGRQKRRTEDMLSTGVGWCTVVGRGQTGQDRTTDSGAHQRLRSSKVLGM